MAKPCRSRGLPRARPPVNAEGATDYLFRGFSFGSTRVGLGGGMQGRARVGKYGGCTPASDSSCPGVLNSPYPGRYGTFPPWLGFLCWGEGYCKSGRISTDEVGLETSSRREPRPLRQRRWLQFCSHFKRVLPERTVRGRSNPHIADPLNP